MITVRFNDKVDGSTQLLVENTSFDVNDDNRYLFESIFYDSIEDLILNLNADKIERVKSDSNY